MGFRALTERLFIGLDLLTERYVLHQHFLSALTAHYCATVVISQCLTDWRFPGVDLDLLGRSLISWGRSDSSESLLNDSRALGFQETLHVLCGSPRPACAGLYLGIRVQRVWGFVQGFLAIAPWKFHCISVGINAGDVGPPGCDLGTGDNIAAML